MFLDAPQSIWQWFDGTLPSPAIAVLASYAKTLYDIKVCDLNVVKKPWEELKRVLTEYRPDLIAIPCTHTCHINEVKGCLQMIRKFHPQALIVGGGVHFHVFYKELIEEGLIDFACLGEGELTFSQLAGKLSIFYEAKRSGKKLTPEEKIAGLMAVDGLAFMANGEVVKTAPRKQIQDLDSIPLPSYELFPMEKYRIPIFGGAETFGITFGRGCQNKCCFCSESFGWDYTLRRNSPEYAVRHIELLYKNFGRSTYIFADTDFLVNADWVRLFIELLKKKDLKINFHIQTCVTSVLRNESLIQPLKEAGLFEIMLGTESPFSEVLKKLKKPQRDPQIMIKAMETVKRHGVLLMTMMLWGTEFDSRETLRKGLEFFDRYSDIVCPNALTPYPGTPLYYELKEKGLIKEENFGLYDQGHVIVPAGKMTYAETQDTFASELTRCHALNWKFYMKLFSENKFLRYNQYYYVKLVWSRMLEGFLSSGKYVKEIYAKKEFEKIMSQPE